MILPNGEYPRKSTPSPPPQTLRLLTSRTRGQSNFSIAARGKADRRAPALTNTPIANKPRSKPYGPTMMLTGVEEIGPAPEGDLLRGGNTRRRSTASPPLASSPTLAKPPMLGRTSSLELPEADITKRFSNGSISVMSDMSGLGEYEGLDDIGSIDGESAIQEDEDEDSDGDGDQTKPDPGSSLGDTQESNGIIHEHDRDDPYSHAAMSRRAERILANAKKRLGVSHPNQRINFLQS